MLAHELAHIKNHDTLTMTITATIAGAISMLAQFGLFFGGNRDNNNGLGMIGTLAMVILAPIAAMLVQMAISRTREYAADELGAPHRRAAGWRWRPRWSGSRTRAHQIDERRRAERNPATAHMFIINPLIGHGMDNLFSTHPATENRIAALQQIAARDGPWRPRRPTAGAARDQPGGPCVGAARAAKRAGRRLGLNAKSRGPLRLIARRTISPGAVIRVLTGDAVSCDTRA